MLELCGDSANEPKVPGHAPPTVVVGLFGLFVGETVFGMVSRVGGVAVSRSGPSRKVMLSYVVRDTGRSVQSSDERRRSCCCVEDILGGPGCEGEVLHDATLLGSDRDNQKKARFPTRIPCEGAKDGKP